MKYSRPELVNALAAEYVLGTLHGRARSRFETLLTQRADIRFAVHDWEQRLGPLASSIAPATPSPEVWRRIQARTTDLASASTFPLKRASWLGWLRPAGWTNWKRPAGWGVGGLATGLIAAAAMFTWAPAVFITADQIAMKSGEKLPQSYVGLLTDAQGSGKVLVSSLRQGKTLTIKIIGPMAAPPPSSVYVLWAVPDQGPAFALGVLPEKGSAVSTLPDTSEKLLSKVTRLIVTQELDAKALVPSEQVVLRGNCAKLW